MQDVVFDHVEDIGRFSYHISPFEGKRSNEDEDI